MLPYFCSFVNHSCDPNVCMFPVPFMDDPSPYVTFVCTAMRDIQPGDELFHCYIHDPSEMKRKDRHAALGFVCTCQHCATGVDLLPESVARGQIDYLTTRLAHATASTPIKKVKKRLFDFHSLLTTLPAAVSRLLLKV